MTARRTTRTHRILPSLCITAALTVVVACDRGSQDPQGEAVSTATDEQAATPESEGEGEAAVSPEQTEGSAAGEQAAEEGFGVSPETMRGEGRPPVTIIRGQQTETFNLGMRRLSPPEIAPLPVPSPRPNP